MNCQHTGLPILFCAHCQNGLPAQMVDDNRGFRRDQLSRAPIGIPSLGQTIANTMSDSSARSIGSGYRIESSNPRTGWGQQQRIKTFSMVMGMTAGGIEPRPHKPNTSEDERILNILLGR
jgi:hypothetical protein